MEMQFSSLRDRERTNTLRRKTERKLDYDNSEFNHPLRMNECLTIGVNRAITHLLIKCKSIVETQMTLKLDSSLFCPNIHFMNDGARFEKATSAPGLALRRK